MDQDYRNGSSWQIENLEEVKEKRQISWHNFQLRVKIISHKHSVILFLLVVTSRLTPWPDPRDPRVAFFHDNFFLMIVLNFHRSCRYLLLLGELLKLLLGKRSLGFVLSVWYRLIVFWLIALVHLNKILLVSSLISSVEKSMVDLLIYIITVEILNDIVILLPLNLLRVCCRILRFMNFGDFTFAYHWVCRKCGFFHFASCRTASLSRCFTHSLRSVGTELLLKIWNGILLQNVFGFCCLLLFRANMLNAAVQVATSIKFRFGLGSIHAVRMAVINKFVLRFSSSFVDGDYCVLAVFRMGQVSRFSTYTVVVALSFLLLLVCFDLRFCILFVGNVWLLYIYNFHYFSTWAIFGLYDLTSLRLSLPHSLNCG